MKKILLLICSVCVVSATYSQEKLTDYQMDFFSSKSYDIEVSKPNDKGSYDVFIDIQNSDSDDRAINLIIPNDKIEPFKDAVKKAKEKYIEWRQVAIDNNVKDLSKKVDVKFPIAQVGFIYGREWRFDFSVGLSSRFLVIDGENYLLIIDTDEAVASDNKFMKAEGYVIFSDVEEIDDFLNKLDMDALNQFANKLKSAEDLFQ